MSGDLVQRLRAYPFSKDNLFHEAADRIEQLQREKDYAEFCLRERTETLDAYKKAMGR